MNELKSVGSFKLLPPAKDACQQCAVKHPPENPHNAQSLYCSSNIVALAIQNPDGTVTVTDVLCNNFPTLSRDKITALSWKLCEFGKANG